jgi:c(7)-type cytochrome triheme protein
MANRLLTYLCSAVLLVLAAGAGAQDNRTWKPLATDGIHDPANPALGQLQAPAEALSKLPAQTAGDRVRWVEALNKGLIAPRAGREPKSGTEAAVLDLDLVLDPNGSMRPVLFPHRDHTQLLECTNCHEGLFKMQAGASQISMLRILEGEQCGVCHGAVAFPLTECNRCHSLPFGAKAAPGGKP